MDRPAREFVEEILKLRSSRRLDELTERYTTDAVIVRHDGAARGHAEIRSFLAGLLTAHGKVELSTLDEVTQVDDVVLFDAMVETTAGFLQVSEVLILDESGLIRRHVPGLRGYWGQ